MGNGSSFLNDFYLESVVVDGAFISKSVGTITLHKG